MPFLLDPLPWHSVARKFFVLLHLSVLLVAILTVDVFSVSLYGFFKVHFSPAFFLLASGDGEIRTLDPLLARQVLSQLSYAPIFNPAATCSPISSPIQYHRPLKP